VEGLEGRVTVTPSGKRILITGHDGYIGAVLAPYFTAAGYEVVGLDTGLFGACGFGDDAALRALPALRRDLREVTADDLQGFDAVIHLAGLSNDPLGDLDSGLTYDINERGSLRLAQAAKQAGVGRFLFSSSCSNYGAAGDDFLDEAAEFQPVTPYAESKVRFEAELEKLADDDFTPTSLRNATAYGVSSRLRLDLVLNNLVGWAHTTGRVRLLSDGSPWRPIVHIEDITRAFLAVLEAPREKVHARAFNVGRTSENYRIRDLARIVAEEVPGTVVEIAEGAGPDKRNYRVSCDLIARELPNFEPRWDARLGARELIDAYRTIGLTKEDFDGPRYKRLAHIQGLLRERSLTPDLRWA
jgi:nucleoside-diphosphate-sugar epimerase